MSCSMVSRGDRIDLVVVRGEPLIKILNNIYNKILKNKYFKIEGAFELNSEPISLNILGHNGEITHICLDYNNDTIRGDLAYRWLLSRARKEANRGYLEILRLSEQAYKLDTEVEPSSKLSEPKSLKLEEPSSIAVSKNKENNVEKEELENKYILNINIKAEEMDSSSLAITMTRLILCSQLLGTYKNLKVARGEVEKTSSSDPEHFYRMLVELRDGSILNIFYRHGKLCAIIVLQPGGLEARVSKANPDSVFATITPESISIIRLYKIECTNDMEALFGKCSSEKSESEEKSLPDKEELDQIYRKEEEKKKKRRIWFIIRKR